jgi:hypothetical protein
MLLEPPTPYIPYMYPALLLLSYVYSTTFPAAGSSSAIAICICIAIAMYAHGHDPIPSHHTPSVWVCVPAYQESDPESHARNLKSRRQKGKKKKKKVPASRQYYSVQLFELFFPRSAPPIGFIGILFPPPPRRHVLYTEGGGNKQYNTTVVGYLYPRLLSREMYIFVLFFFPIVLYTLVTPSFGFCSDFPSQVLSTQVLHTNPPFKSRNTIRKKQKTNKIK